MLKIENLSLVQDLTDKEMISISGGGNDPFGDDEPIKGIFVLDPFLPLMESIPGGTVFEPGLEPYGSPLKPDPTPWG
jgi:hypothetical protein